MDKKIEFSFKRLDVWKIGMKLTNKIYTLRKQFPKEEQFALSAQLKRAVISVPLNIAEGATRRSKKEFIQFIRIALGSLMEVVACLEIAKEQKYSPTVVYEEIEYLIQELYFKLLALEKSLKQLNI